MRRIYLESYRALTHIMSTGQNTLPSPYLQPPLNRPLPTTHVDSMVRSVNELSRLIFQRCHLNL